MQLFYNPRVDASTETVKFAKKESGHIIKSLRKVTGDEIHITNGLGYLFSAEIIDSDPNHCRVKITASSLKPPLPYQLHMAVAPTKSNDRYEWFLEKAVELGVAQITPILCDHSERKHVNLKRYERILQSAMKQSLQTYLPRLNPVQKLMDFIISDWSGDGFMAHCEEENKFRLKEVVRTKSPTTILVGPEGDFSRHEIDRALQAGFNPVDLGPHRLRTETAAIAACHTVSLVNF